MPGGDEIRDVQRAAWAGLSAGWEKWDPVIMDQLGPVGTAMIGRLGIAGDQQHLDIAAGTGEPGLTVARLAPAGHVVLTDLAAEMLGIAARRAGALGITNFQATVCSADDLPFGDAAFDSILGTVRVHVLSRRRQGDRRVRARAQAGRACVLVGLGRARGEPVDDDRHAGNRGRGGAGAIRSGRPGHVPVRCPGICQCPVPGRGAGRGGRVGRRRRTGDGLARAVLGDDQRARLARSCGACAGRRPARERIAKAVIARASTYE